MTSYVTPTSVEDALAVLQEQSECARIIAGGTDILPDMRAGKRAPACLVDAGPGLLAAVLAAAALALAGANALFKHALGRFIRHW